MSLIMFFIVFIIKKHARFPWHTLLLLLSSYLWILFEKWFQFILFCFEWSFRFFKQNRRRELFFSEFLEINVGKEGIQLDLRDRRALFRIFVQYTSEEPFSFIGEILGHLEIPLLYILVKHFDVFTVKGWYADQHLIENDPYLIDVTCLSHTLLLQHLRC